MANPSPHRRWLYAAGATAIAAAVAAAIAAAVIHFPRRSGSGQKSELVSACRTAVTAKLPVPDTAQWPGDEVVSSIDFDWTVAGSVNSRNRYGALARDRWTCHATRLAVGWGAVTAVVDGQRGD